MQEIVYHTNYELEDTYWWFQARQFIIDKLIHKYTDLKNHDIILDAGCGTGGFAAYISQYFQVIGLDTSKTAIEFSKKRGIKTIYNQVLGDFDSSKHAIKAITMLDVIEHIEDDLSVMQDAYNKLPKEGYFIVSVPAYQWLWSNHDRIHMHYRRYTKSHFNELLKKAGFEIEFSSYFNSFLFLPGALKRIVQKILGKESEDPVDHVSPWMNNLFNCIFRSEAVFLGPLTFPCGLSIVTICKKV